MSRLFVRNVDYNCKKYEPWLHLFVVTLLMFLGFEYPLSVSIVMFYLSTFCVLPLLHCQEVRWALERLGIKQRHGIQAVRAGYTRQLAVTLDHCSMFLVFGDRWSMQHALNTLNGKHIQGISEQGIAKCSLAFI